MSCPGRLPVIIAVKTRKNPTRHGSLGLARLITTPFSIDHPHCLRRRRSVLRDRRKRRPPLLEAASREAAAAATGRRGSLVPKRGHRHGLRRILRPHREAPALEQRGEFHLPSAARMGLASARGKPLYRPLEEVRRANCTFLGSDGKPSLDFLNSYLKIPL